MSSSFFFSFPLSLSLKICVLLRKLILVFRGTLKHFLLLLMCLLQLLGEPGTGGSSTPSMVGAVKKWQKSDPQKSLETWRKLSEANSSLEVQLNMLSKLAEEHWDAYKCTIENCSRLKSDKVSLELIFLHLQRILYK